MRGAATTTFGLAGMDGDKGTVVAAANDGVSVEGTAVVDGIFASSDLVDGSVSILAIVYFGNLF